MVDEGILQFLRVHGKQGYSPQQMRAHLISVGQNPRDIDDAIWKLQQETAGAQAQYASPLSSPQQLNNAQNTTVVQHKHSLSSGTLILLAICLIGIVGIATLMLLPKGEEQLLDYTIETTVREIHAGETLVFIDVFSNMGSKKSYDVFPEYAIVNADSAKILDSWEETKGVTLVNKNSITYDIPSDAPSGKYYVRGIVRYDNKIARARSKTFVLNGEGELPQKGKDQIQDAIGSEEESAESNGEDTENNNVLLIDATCYDGLLNQDEEGIDCGGSCNSKCDMSCSCDDDIICTTVSCDATTNFMCEYETLEACCGNGICEEGETCQLDCAKSDQEEALLTIKQATTIAESNSKRGRDTCDKIKNVIYREECISAVAQAVQNTEMCGEVSDRSRQDLCLMTIALQTNTYEICEALYDEETMESCLALRSMNNG